VGAFVGARTLLQEVSRELPVHVPSLEECDVEELEYIGDLGGKLRPLGHSTFVRVKPRAPRAALVDDHRVRNTGRRIEYAAADAGAEGLDCLVYGDSFAVRVLPFLAESFRRLTFVHMPNLDFDLVTELRPEVVVKIMSERFMIVVPVDLPVRTQAEMAAEKVAAGEVMQPPREPRAGRAISLPDPRGPADAGRAQAPRA
jgi:alginate O-acetyltransferase complex protein AlgJ